jgi:hypothetical protein
MQTLRFADPATLTQYPLEIAGVAPWQPDSPGRWRVDVPLPPLAGGEIIAPSLSVLDRDGYRYRVVLEAGERAYPLRPVPSTPEDATHPDPGDRYVRTAIDCFHIHHAFQDARLRVWLDAADPPERYLLTVSIRPVDITVADTADLPDLRTATPPTFSQMLANPLIGRRICSPASTAMVLKHHRPSVNCDQVVAACLDPVTGMYGMWPMAIHCASRCGVIGAVELFADWSPVLDCLRAGLPLVASIRYAAGALPGTPQPQTGGHLVVVFGIESGMVLVNDPAAPHHGSVTRRYPIAAFSQAWFRHRGAAYILAP